MKLLLLTDDIYPFAGGTTRVCGIIAEYMAARGHEVMIVGPRASDPSAKFIYRAGAIQPLSTAQGTLWPSKHDMQATVDFAPDVIHTHTERGAFLWAQKLSDTLGTPHVHTMHADYSVLHRYHGIAKLFSLYLWGVRQKFRTHIKTPSEVAGYYDKGETFIKMDWRFAANISANVDFFTTPSPRIYDFVSQCGYGDKGVLLPFGINESWIAPAVHKLKQPSNILWVGRVTPEKRPEVALEAFIKLRQSGVAATMSFVGEGEDIPSLQAVIAKTPYAKDVTFHGLVKDKVALRQLYADADLFALSSYHFETQGLVLLEAAGAGLPIVYCDERLVTGVSSGNAVLTDPSPEAMAEGMASIIKDPKLHAKLAAASLEEAKRFPLSQTMSEFEKIYLRLTKRDDEQTRQSSHS